MQRSTSYAFAVLTLFFGAACSGSAAEVSSIGGNSSPSGWGTGGDGGATGHSGGPPIINVDSLDAGSHLQYQHSPDAKMRCDDQGNCSCLAIASLGKVAHYGNQSNGGDNTNAFQTYMNTQTKGSATMALFGSATGSTKTFTLTADFLKNYDVIILQALEDSEYTGFWTDNFSADEVTALSDWVNNGGGLIAMSGYGSQSDEVKPLNKLLAPFGISYQPSPDIFVQNDCTNNMCYCADGSIPFGGWNPSDTPLVNSLNSTNHQVGVFWGRPITCSDCQVMATWQNNTLVGVHKQVGAGRVFAWADEWVTYTSQWNGDPTFQSQAQCGGYTADKIYDIPQFWYNVFRWVSGDSACFTIDDPQVKVY